MCELLGEHLEAYRCVTRGERQHQLAELPLPSLPKQQPAEAVGDFPPDRVGDVLVPRCQVKSRQVVYDA